MVLETVAPLVGAVTETVGSVVSCRGAGVLASLKATT